MTHDVFISYSSKNKTTADAICHVLEENGIRCWIAPRDIAGGQKYGDVIDSAIKECKVFVLVFSEFSKISPWVECELNLAFTDRKIIIPFKIDNSELEGEMRLMLNNKHWIDAFPNPEVKFKDIVEAVLRNIERQPNPIINKNTDKHELNENIDNPSEINNKNYEVKETNVENVLDIKLNKKNKKVHSKQMALIAVSVLVIIGIILIVTKQKNSINSEVSYHELTDTIVQKNTKKGNQEDIEPNIPKQSAPINKENHEKFSQNETIPSNKSTGTFTDSRDSKVYKWVKIGKQIWMAENLAYKADTGCWAYDNNEENVKTYGYLYDWVTARNVCPKGWHLATLNEWKILFDFLGGEKVAGGKLKEIGIAYWQSSNELSTNKYGFTAIPGGIGNPFGFSNMRYDGFWWSSNECDSLFAWMLRISSDNIIYKSCGGKYNSLSVRCIKN